MVTVCTKEDVQKVLSDKIAKLTVNVEDKECKNETAEAVGDSETCRTPTAKEHRIPEPLSCPPAPRKRKGSFSVDKTEPKKTVDDTEIETIFSVDQDPASKTSSRQ
ncbi:cyclin-dependent protein kinase inhibitor SMR3-like [Durio zibethinus]|uniref:Cyclin-dependent protein kinase inhibitor SMR3-like n=1 Tax=Durio zibethinus TaxID=66656 RepID=A0A6P5ZY84_DURZI|nr:cyclin-dependent protein kinase inhibitor SMR3-like [Durio zibethinus]